MTTNNNKQQQQQQRDREVTGNHPTTTTITTMTIAVEWVLMHTRLVPVSEANKNNNKQQQRQRCFVVVVVLCVRWCGRRDVLWERREGGSFRSSSAMEGLLSLEA
jgi:hypothetical protein